MALNCSFSGAAWRGIATQNNRTVLVSNNHQPLPAHYKPVLVGKWKLKGKVVRLSHVVGKTTMFLSQSYYWSAVYRFGRGGIFFSMYLHQFWIFLLNFKFSNWYLDRPPQLYTDLATVNVIL